MHPITLHIQELEQQLSTLLKFIEQSHNLDQDKIVFHECMLIKQKLKHFKSLDPKYYEFQNFEIEIETVNSKINSWQSN